MREFREREREVEREKISEKEKNKKTKGEMMWGRTERDGGGYAEFGGGYGGRERGCDAPT